MDVSSVHGPQLVRLQYLLERLNGGGQMTTRLAAEELQVSRRTISSDLEYLRQIGAPISYDRQARTYRLSEPFGNLPLLALQRSEFASFLVARFALEAMGDSATAAVMKKVTARLAEHLPEHVHVAPDEIEALVRYTTGPHAPPPTSTIAKLQPALSEQHVMRIRYHAPSRNETTERDVEPYALLSYSGSWYLIAHCRLREGMRDFRVDRISSAVPTGDYFARNPAFDLDAYLGPAFSVYHGEEEHTVRLRFSAYQARWIREGQWHETQVMIDRPDGSLDLLMTVRGLSDVARWALSYGGECEVLAPEVLRHRVAVEARTMAERYRRAGRAIEKT